MKLTLIYDTSHEVRLKLIDKGSVSTYLPDMGVDLAVLTSKILGIREPDRVVTNMFSQSCDLFYSGRAISIPFAQRISIISSPTVDHVADLHWISDTNNPPLPLSASGLYIELNNRQGRILSMMRVVDERITEIEVGPFESWRVKDV